MALESKLNLLGEVSPAKLSNPLVGIFCFKYAENQSLERLELRTCHLVINCLKVGQFAKRLLSSLFDSRSSPWEDRRTVRVASTGENRFTPT